MEKSVKRGRPKGKPFPHQVCLRFSPACVVRIHALAEKLAVSQSEVARKAILELAIREGVDIQPAQAVE